MYINDWNRPYGHNFCPCCGKPYGAFGYPSNPWPSIPPSIEPGYFLQKPEELETKKEEPK